MSNVIIFLLVIAVIVGFCFEKRIAVAERNLIKKLFKKKGTTKDEKI